ncbi:MAG TPA: PIN domain-containing protein [Burkholderiaceae bacterium]|jgi:predicted nucleic acid-binding protein|nr:PIN domain-containing protein [Burkholderiaceae bacterium]
MRAVIDTNILVSGLLRPDGPPGAVLRQVALLTLEPVACREIMAEYRAVLPRRRLRLRPDDIDDVLSLFEAQALWVEVPAYDGSPPLPDPTDWAFIACALAAGCPVVTGNAKHFPAQLGVKVMTAREWVGWAAEHSRARS